MASVGRSPIYGIPLRGSQMGIGQPGFLRSKFRHGSGAAGSDPMDDVGPQLPRRRRSNSPGRRDHLQPGGPMNAADWSDQVEWLQRQLTTLSKTVADHAHLLGQLTNAESGAIPAVNARLSSLTTF